MSITLTEDLSAAIELRRLGLRYRSMAEYLVALAREDIATQRDHERAGEWAALPAEDREKVDAGLLRMQREGRLGRMLPGFSGK